MKYNQPMLRDGALNDKVIIVTGGGSGLGKSMSKYFLQLGAKVVITSRKIEKLQKAAAELEKETGGEVLALACDVRRYDQVEKVLEDAVKHFGTVNGWLTMPQAILLVRQNDCQQVLLM
jgi:NAD(P)-dependent dehydrogenase (short-subunit alcohol dehydrogenase family)